MAEVTLESLTQLIQGFQGDILTANLDPIKGGFRDTQFLGKLKLRDVTAQLP